MRRTGADRMRTEWATDCRNVLQGAVGSVVCGDPECVSGIVRAISRRLPGPEDLVESFVLRQSLVLFVGRLGTEVHREFHRRFDPVRCVAAPDPESEQYWLGADRQVAELLDGWAERYRRWFEEHHRIPPALRARRILDQRVSDPIPLGNLAALVGSSRTRLAAQFTQFFGIPPGEYATRLRLRAALTRLREGVATVDVAANVGGYQSRGKFSAAVRKHTRMTPSQIRHLAHDDFWTLLEDALALDVPGQGSGTRQVGPCQCRARHTDTGPVLP
jgi:AraC-like DNA-binding protein